MIMKAVNLANDNIVILNRVRLIAILGQLVLIICSITFLDIELPIPHLVFILAVEIVFAMYAKRIALLRKVSQSELVFYILLDSIILTGLVYYSGGANNPFIYLLLLYVAIASFMLQRKRLVLLVSIELTLYSLLNVYQRPLEFGESSPLASFHLHLAGMWVNFFLTAILLAVFGLITRTTLLKQEKKLQSLREKNLQDEQVLGLGIMSANAAHELGTPLSTMAIVIDDIQHSNISESQCQDMDILKKQILRCRNIIDRLNDKSLHAQHQLTHQTNNNIIESQENNLINQFQLIAERWLVYQPKISLRQNYDRSIETAFYQISISLEQAITNLLDNAADASLDNSNNEVYLKIYLSDRNIVIDITDKGTGLVQSNKTNAGKRIQTSNKKDGLGWGMFLSNVSIERVGGSVQILDDKIAKDSLKNTGCVTRIVLPIKLIDVR